MPATLEDYVSSQSTSDWLRPVRDGDGSLTAISGALDHRFAVKMQRGGDWWEHPRIWALLVGDPSTKKTPCINAATGPLDWHEANLGREYKAKLRDYEKRRRTRDNTVAQPDPPVRYVVIDTTAEKLGEILSSSDHGLLAKRDEFSGWIGDMDRYDSGRTRPIVDFGSKATTAAVRRRPHRPWRDPYRQPFGQPARRHPARPAVRIARPHQRRTVAAVPADDDALATLPRDIENEIDPAKY